MAVDTTVEATTQSRDPGVQPVLLGVDEDVLSGRQGGAEQDGRQLTLRQVQQRAADGEGGQRLDRRLEGDRRGDLRTARARLSPRALRRRGSPVGRAGVQGQAERGQGRRHGGAAVQIAGAGEGVRQPQSERGEDDPQERGHDDRGADRRGQGPPDRGAASGGAPRAGRARLAARPARQS